ncbi:hypothetical protein [Alteripontixanthobacter maritimus]|uniref:hypothetical protein n=1 Tax=Alteripontixanthobacter maritimus TaxID=2161824 RepID=UPI0011C03D60|nr:hypothetical protein [Alteripontixanthobacter maritimus]
MRRSLVLTDEAAGNLFLASLPPHVRSGAEPKRFRPQWGITRNDVKSFAAAYFACLAGAAIFLA